ncbi:MAG: UDP-N-acetylglucosamine 2-epimerase (hydrolyzing) [Candidatus Omnitrophota bacterium]|nr:MAG: UDP-N-acetylglucosamine 2-epimerase (hydrolyzing) [Candidatus Omnitrophota bacterium]
MRKKKVCVVITTRGNYAKMKSVMKNIRQNPELELQVIVGGGAILPKYGNIVGLIEDDHMAINRVIHFLVEGENPVTMAKSAGLAITEFSTAFENLRPDAVIVMADRFECLAIAMAATYMNIPIAHVEGGEVSGSIDESVRHSITKLSHLHFPATEDAAERIKRLGEDPATVFTVGCTSLDVISEIDLANIESLMGMQKKIGLGPLLDLHKPYLAVIQHPVTTEYEKNLFHVNETIKAISALKMNTVWIWPNMDAGSDGTSKGIRVFREKSRPSYVHFFRSLPIEYYAPLLKNTACIVGNSSSGIREAGFLGTPCVNIGTRQKGRQRAKNIIDTDYNAKGIEEAIRTQIKHGNYEPDYTYGDGKAGERIAKIIKDFEFAIQKKIMY